MNSSRAAWPISHDRRPVGSRWTLSFIAAAIALAVASFVLLVSPGTVSATGAFTFASGTLTYTDDAGGGSNLQPTLTGGVLTIEGHVLAGVSNGQIQRLVIDAGDGNDTIPLDAIDYAANGFREDLVIEVRGGTGDDLLRFFPQLLGPSQSVRFDAGTGAEAGGDTAALFGPAAAGHTFSLVNDFLFESTLFDGGVFLSGAGGFAYTNLETLTVTAGGANDNFTITGTPDNTAVTVSGGGAQDFFLFSGQPGLAGLRIEGQNGNAFAFLDDTLDINLSAGNDSFTITDTTMTIDTGRDGVTGVIDYVGIRRIFVSANDGNDLFTVDSLLVNVDFLTLRGNFDDDTYDINFSAFLPNQDLFLRPEAPNFNHLLSQEFGPILVGPQRGDGDILNLDVRGLSGVVLEAILEPIKPDDITFEQPLNLAIVAPNGARIDYISLEAINVLADAFSDVDVQGLSPFIDLTVTAGAASQSYPTIFGVSDIGGPLPANGPLAGGDQIQILGNNLDDLASLTIGGIDVTLFSNSGRTFDQASFLPPAAFDDLVQGNNWSVLDVTVPAGLAPGKAPIVAINNDGISSVIRTFELRQDSFINISQFQPDTIPAHMEFGNLFEDQYIYLSDGSPNPDGVIAGLGSGPLTRANLNGATVIVSLDGGTFIDPLDTNPAGLFSVVGIPPTPPGTTIAFGGVKRLSDTLVELTLVYDDSEFLTDEDLSVRVDGAAIAIFSNSATTGTINVIAIPVAGSSALSDLALDNPFTALSPAFTPPTTAYTASVAGSVPSIELTATLTDPAASFTVTLNGGIPAAGTSGVAFPLTLTAGANIILVAVTATDASTTVYSVVIGGGGGSGTRHSARSRSAAPRRSVRPLRRSPRRTAPPAASPAST